MRTAAEKRERDRLAKAALRAERRRRKRCVQCGKRKWGRSSSCSRCVARQTAQQNRRRGINRARGVCYDCGRVRAVPGRGKCAECAYKRDLYRLKRLGQDVGARTAPKPEPEQRTAAPATRPKPKAVRFVRVT